MARSAAIGLASAILATVAALWAPARAAARRPGWRLPGRRGARVRVPMVLQMEAVECGAACLGMILGAHGRYVPLEELRLACGVSRDGTKASNILRAAERYGLRAKGYSKEPGALPALPLPFIVFWGFNHFVVVEGFGRGRVFLNDPATGPRSVSDDELDESFTGIVLIFRPGPAFERGGAPPGALPALLRRARGAGPLLTLATVAGLGIVAMGLVVPTLIRVFLDTYIATGSRDWVGLTLGGIGLAAVLRAGLGWLEGRVLVQLWRRTAAETSSELFWHILRLPIPFFQQRHAGEIGARIGLNDELAGLLALDISRAGLRVLVMVVYVGLMLQYDVLLTLVGIGFALLNIVALWLVAQRQVDLNRRLSLEYGLLSGASVGGLFIMETLKASGAEDDFFARWSGLQARALETEHGVDLLAHTLNLLPGLLETASTAVVLLIGGARIMQGELTVGELVAFQVLLGSFLAPVGQLVGMAGVIQTARADVERLDDVLRHPLDPAIAADPIRTGPTAGRLELRDVSFGYSRLELPLIQSLDLTLEPGRCVALVGGSGSGKSTVARLVAGLYEPWSGAILFDGHPRAAYDRPALSAVVGSVDQDLFIFEGTVRENLTLWDYTVDDAALERALEDAGLHDEVASRPGGLDAVIAVGGSSLSGGQRLRLEIARALIRDPRLLVLDEATSALDPIAEATIMANLRRRGCALLLVAHRLSTVRDADEIVVLERGRVVERGTHLELLARGGAYARLIEAV